MRSAKKLIAMAFTAAALFTATNVNAQSISKSKLRLGIGVEGLLPVGDLRTTANFALGVTPRLQYGIADNVALTLTSGYYHFFTKEINIPGIGTFQNDLAIVPVKLGLKAFISPNVYIGAEAGAGFEVDNGGGNTKFIASPGIGYASQKWDAGIRYESFSGQNYNYSVLALRLAYGFGL